MSLRAGCTRSRAERQDVDATATAINTAAAAATATAEATTAREVSGVTPCGTTPIETAMTRRSVRKASIIVHLRSLEPSG